LSPSPPSSSSSLRRRRVFSGCIAGITGKLWGA
jgi:hypothetical protein